ncbi:MAG: winged helix-turn-helix transcriptional regulator [Proteobacteria bacterium]|nr:winged helix-turn-helix transcriptional regulator [Pseudomonadota bacterium]
MGVVDIDASATTVKKLDPALQAAWIGLLRVPQALLAEVQNDLKKRGFPPLEWYDVLLELSLRKDGRLRQRDLAERLLVARYNLSRLLDRLEAEGLVRREPCEDDARGAMVAITAEGRTLRQAMWPSYAEAIQARFGNRLPADMVQVLAEAFGRLSREPH